MDNVFEEFICKNFSENVNIFFHIFMGNLLIPVILELVCIYVVYLGREKKIENVWHIYDLDLLKYHQWIYELCSNFIIITAVKWAHLLSSKHDLFYL
jgi:hypothetical protein